VRFPRQAISLFTEAIRWRNGFVPGTWTDDQLDAHRGAFDDRLLELVMRPREVPE
jgi:transposase